ncbi:MAG: YigZ family protein [Ruminococcaceae bacterium]|nr:YigZ family protein [Oscillospiraceae bacterium]
MTEYLIPSGYGEAELVEKRSRFIGRVWVTETEEEAVARIKEMRDKHWDATHNVYAYIIRDSGIMRYSDDGEPQGTSGMPTLNVFRGEGIQNVCCVVTRYFGGILLGTGGLVRAYSAAAKAALVAAGVSVVRLWKEMVLACKYSQYEAVMKELASFDGIAADIDYGVDIMISALLPEEKAEAFTLRVFDITQGTVMCEIVGEEFRAVKLENGLK